jgi:geranylgeranyl diphosphate synthase type II
MYGKEILGDLFEGKRTLMIIHALQQATARERARLQRFLALERSARTAAEVRWVRALLERTSAMEHARLTARALAGAALYEFDAIFGAADGRDAQFIRCLITWVLRRLH